MPQFDVIHSYNDLVIFPIILYSLHFTVHFKIFPEIVASVKLLNKILLNFLIINYITNINLSFSTVPGSLYE